MAYDLYARILGGLIGAGAGDGMGASTEARTTHQIKEYFGGLVTDFVKPPMDTFAAGNVPGQATDDFSSAYFLAESIVKNKGLVDEDAIKTALINWSEFQDGIFFNRFAGPTTRLAIRRYKGEEIAASPGTQLVSRQATNGGAMRISPLGLLNPGNLDKTVAESVTVTMITHDNYLAISSACAVSCAVSQALTEEADLYKVLQAAIYGAKEGEKIGKETAKDVAGPSVLRRMEKAIEIGLGSGSLETKMIEIGAKIGAGLHAAEAIPAAIGCVAAAQGNPVDTIICAVNMGYDTDTIATMCGAISGALKGARAFPNHYLPTLEKANGLEIEVLAKGIHKIAVQRMKGGKSNG